MSSSSFSASVSSLSSVLFSSPLFSEPEPSALPLFSPVFSVSAGSFVPGSVLSAVFSSSAEPVPFVSSDEESVFSSSCSSSSFSVSAEVSVSVLCSTVSGVSLAFTLVMFKFEMTKAADKMTADTLPFHLTISSLPPIFLLLFFLRRCTYITSEMYCTPHTGKQPPKQIYFG